VEIGEQCRHLHVIEPAHEGGHQAFPGKYYATYLRVCCGRTTWQRRSLEKAMKIGRRLLQREVIVLMTMRAAYLVKVLPLHLLRCELWGLVAPRKH